MSNSKPNKQTLIIGGKKISLTDDELERLRVELNGAFVPRCDFCPYKKGSIK